MLFNLGYVFMVTKARGNLTKGTQFGSAAVLLNILGCVFSKLNGVSTGVFVAAEIAAFTAAVMLIREAAIEAA